MVGEINIRVKFCDTITPHLTLKFRMFYQTHGYGVDFLDRSNFVLAREMPTALFSFSRKLHLVARDHIYVFLPHGTKERPIRILLGFRFCCCHIMIRFRACMLTNMGYGSLIDSLFSSFLSNFLSTYLHCKLCNRTVHITLWSNGSFFAVLIS